MEDFPTARARKRKGIAHKEMLHKDGGRALKAIGNKLLNESLHAIRR